MSNDSGSQWFIDGIGSLIGGMNAGIVPELIDPTQTAFSTNCTHRGGFVRGRPGMRRITVTYENDAQKILVENNLWQGAGFFKSEYGEQGIVISVGGRQFFILPDSSEGATCREITPTNSDGSLDPNSSGNKIAWIWQSERWCIIADGSSYPIFYDGAASRRSMGDPYVVGTTSADFTVPALGSSVDITLIDDYNGPVNELVQIGNAYYQVNSSGVGYGITLKNLSETSSSTFSSGDLIGIPTNLIGQLSKDETAYSTSLPSLVFVVPTS